jgi:MarR family transcriptional regulator for hemolysin
MKTPRDNSIGAQMHLASQALRRRMHNRIHQLGYQCTMEQLAVLEVLKFNGAMNMSEIANAIIKENAAITRMVDVMERRGLVERKSIAGDRRAKAIHIKKSGLDVFDELIPKLVLELKEATSCITKEENDEVLRIMKKIIKHNEGF